MTDRPARVVAQGTFDLLHPGHLHYLREASEYGETVHVIVARRANVTHKDPPILSDEQRLEMVGALDPGLWVTFEARATMTCRCSPIAAASRR